MSYDEFIAGMKNIEQAISEGARSKGITIDAFRWNKGQDFLPPPEAIPLEVGANGRKASAVFSREHLEDSHRSAGDRPEVGATIRKLVAVLAGG